MDLKCKALFYLSRPSPTPGFLLRPALCVQVWNAISGCRDVLLLSGIRLSGASCPLPPRSSPSDVGLRYIRNRSLDNSCPRECNAAADKSTDQRCAAQTPASAETSVCISPPADAARSKAEMQARNADSAETSRRRPNPHLPEHPGDIQS